ncbi:MAG TPA: hypothetical protein VK636_15125 [Gemmatimonadaceae bacterium]|nr:hypothetical protein [Gemmatimonadaceae bacterium]
MRVHLSPIMFALAIAIIPAAVAAQTDKKADVTGKWLFTVNTDAGSGTPTVTLKQQGDSITGHYSSQTFGEADFKGTVKEQKISFSFRVDMQGTAVSVTYAGTVEGNDAMKGTVDFGGMGGGTFTAKRQSVP